MDEEEIISCFLNQCVQQEVNHIPLEQLPGYDHKYSKHFEKKIKLLFWSNRYFHQKIKIGYAVRRIAIVAVAILGVVATTTVSAKIFGVDPWKYTKMFVQDGKMDVRQYRERNQEKEDIYEKSIKVFNDRMPGGNMCTGRRKYDNQTSCKGSGCEN